MKDHEDHADSREEESHTDGSKHGEGAEVPLKEMNIDLRVAFLPQFRYHPQPSANPIILKTSTMSSISELKNEIVRALSEEYQGAFVKDFDIFTRLWKLNFSKENPKSVERKLNEAFEKTGKFPVEIDGSVIEDSDFKIGALSLDVGEALLCEFMI